MKQFFVAHFTNGYSIEVYCLEKADNSPCDFHLVPCGLDGKPHSVVSECEIRTGQLAMTLDYLQLQMEYADNPSTPKVETLTWVLSEELVDALFK